MYYLISFQYKYGSASRGVTGIEAEEAVASSLIADLLNN